MTLKNLYNRLKHRILKNTIIDNDSSIGKYTYIGYGCIITRASIGNYCSFANQILIGGGEHDIKKVSLNSIFYENPHEILTRGDVIIGNDVRIGNQVIVRRGVKIGNGAVIGANSFVNKDIPPYSIAVGSPAKVIKYRFDNEMIKKIEKTKRREYNPKVAKQLFKNLEIQK